MQTLKTANDKKTLNRTKVYSLSQEFLHRIENIYKVLTKMQPALELSGQEELNAELLRMYEEANETIKGLRQQEKIRFRNETEE